MTANDVDALFQAANLTDRKERKMLADAYEEAGRDVEAQILREVDIDLEVEEEDTPFVGNCSAIDDDEDALTEAWIREELDCGNVWAWCMVTVVATWEREDDEEFEASAYLGACSYQSEKNFKECGYYADMVREAIAELIRDVLG